MFRALLAHPQEMLHRRNLVYRVRVMSLSCTRFGVELRYLSLSDVVLSFRCKNSSKMDNSSRASAVRKVSVQNCVSIFLNFML
jgi:hypothetical protein